VHAVVRRRRGLRAGGAERLAEDNRRDDEVVACGSRATELQGYRATGLQSYKATRSSPASRQDGAAVNGAAVNGNKAKPTDERK